jgi:hypothetical protein
MQKLMAATAPDAGRPTRLVGHANDGFACPRP